jgi:hypothetical protein
MTNPKLTQPELLKLLIPYPNVDSVQVAGIRGYYKTTMGNPVKNDRGIYDDALFILSPDHFGSYNANTDPSIYRKHIATLKPGMWRYKPGIHHIGKPNAYPAFVQAGEVTVARDGEPDETGYFGINIHRGGWNSTSSEGCQTIYPAQWDSFRASLVDQLKRFNQKTFYYILIDNV